MAGKSQIFNTDEIPIIVGPFVFSMVEVAGPLFDEDGTRCMGRVDWERRLFLIDQSVPLRYQPALAAALTALAWRTVTSQTPSRDPA